MKYALLAAALCILAGNAARAEGNYLAEVETPPMAQPVQGGVAAVVTGSERLPVIARNSSMESNFVLNQTGSDAMPAFARQGFSYGAPTAAFAKVGENAPGS